MSREAVHIGLAGCGRWGKLILRDLKSLGCRVSVAVRSEASVANANQHGADRVVGSVDALPDDIQGAVVATPTSLHRETIERLLRRNVPVFTEKPLANSLEAARRILAMAPERVFVMDKWRYHPGVEALAAIARAGELGPVDSIRTTRLGWAITHDDADPIWVLAPHDVAIVLELLGWIPEPVFAAAEIEGGAATGMTGVLGAGPRATITVSARHPRNQRSVTLCCRGGSATLEDSYASHILVRRTRGGIVSPGDPVEQRPVGTAMPLLLELRAFVEHLAGGPPPRSSASEGARVVEVIEKLRSLAGINP